MIFLMAMITISKFIFMILFFTSPPLSPLPQVVRSVKAETRPKLCAVSLVKCAVPNIQ